MNLSTFVKICSISNLSDARYCAGMGVDQLGFRLDPRDITSVSPELFLEIKNWVAGVKFVGEFGNLPSNEIAPIQQQLPLDLIEISTLDQVEPIGLMGKQVIFKLELTTDGDVGKLATTLSYLDELVEYVVLNCKNPDLYEMINKAVSFYQGRLKLLRGFDVTVETVNTINGYAGIELTSTEEQDPGLKEYGEIMDILEELEVD
ncbi:MAG: hypothetical protein GY816_07965 [Cytophagales bacterium]|nr:hypothetical protein [Cytophagales bacterium]